MSARATAKNTGLSAKRVRPVIDMVRGMPVEDALNALRFMPSPAARIVAKVVRSASANAEIELPLRRAKLMIVGICADEGPRTKRFRIRARGRTARITRGNSHITVVVDEGQD